MTKAAYNELAELSLDLFDIAEVFEKGFDCSRSRRKLGKLERCLRVGEKLLRAVVAEDYNDFLQEDVLVLIHVSSESWKKGRFVQ